MLYPAPGPQPPPNNPCTLQPDPPANKDTLFAGSPLPSVPDVETPPADPLAGKSVRIARWSPVFWQEARDAKKQNHTH